MTKPKAKAKAKKAEPDKDAGANLPPTAETKGGESQSTSAGSAGRSSPCSASHKVQSTAWFITEIQAMMHGFGDSRKPLLESAKLIEEIVHQQMNSLLLQLAEIAVNRGARFIGLEDIVFLLRKDKVKLGRLIRYLGIRDLKSTSIKGTEEGGDESVGEISMDTAAKVIASPVKKRQKVCYNFLSTIDQTGELLALFDDPGTVDEVKMERNQRADIQSRNMNYTQYLEFADARSTSFTRKYRSTKFRDWILKDNLTDIKPSTIALKIFNYLAYETVAQIVDLTLIVKRDASTRANDSVSCIVAPQSFNHGFPSVGLHQLSKSSQTTAATPPHSPRLSASPPSSLVSSGLVVPQSSTSHASSSTTAATTAAVALNVTKPKPKKRKKSGGNGNQPVPYAQTIQPSEIREAIRRYWQPTGPLTLFSRFNCNYMGKVLLCN